MTRHRWILPLLALCVWVKAQPQTAIHLDDPDRACASCHQAIYDEYERTNMARGSGLAVDGLIPGTFEHKPSGITYKVFQRDNQAWMSYERPGTAAPLHGSRQLLYYIGSGHRGRTYLFQQENLWFEAPINYYGKKQIWDMAPNYGNARTMPLTLPVDANCLHCHASEVSTSIQGVRNEFSDAPLKAAGIGCAACHGDPSLHLASEQAHRGPGAIVNPAKLSPAARDSTCLQCHLEGDASIYKPGKSLATYKPGENLADSAVYFVNTSRTNFGNRATSQYEALLRSACKRASGDKLTCTNCHDPHSSPPPEQRVAYYRAKCLVCHTGGSISKEHHPEQQDCASCHMPTRETSDISHEQLTDHDIEARPRAAVPALILFDPGEHPSAPSVELAVVGAFTATDRELGLAYAQMARTGDRRSAAKALELLSKTEKAGGADGEVHAQLGLLLQLSGDRAGAEAEYLAALSLSGQDATVFANYAVLLAREGRVDKSEELLRRSIRLDPSATAAGLDLAFIECSRGQAELTAQTLSGIGLFNPDDAQLRAFTATGKYGGSKCAPPASAPIQRAGKR